MANKGAIGFMEGAYFVPRGELLDWLNELLELDYTKVEQTCNAAAITQLMDILYPGQVAMSKIKYNAIHEYEYVANFKVLQNVFDKQKIDRYIDVPKLIKGKYQDNLEFLQWAKRYFELNHNPSVEYNAKERRAQAKCPYANDGKSRPANKENRGPPPRKSYGPKVSAPGTKAAPRAKATSKVSTQRRSPVQAKEAGNIRRGGAAGGASPDARVKQLTKDKAELETMRDALEKERDFYFGRLREIELYLQDQDQENDVVKGVLGILYNPADDEEAAGGEADEEEDVQEEIKEDKDEAGDDDDLEEEIEGEGDE